MFLNLPNTKWISLMFVAVFFLVSCSSDDDASEQLSQCSQLTTQAIVNGDNTFTLLSAQRSTTSGFEGSVNIFQLAAISADCNTVHTLQLFLEVDSSIGGTYDVVDFFDAELNDAHGSIVVQNLSTMSSNLSEIASGTLQIIDNGNSSLTIDFEGTLVGGGDSSFKTTHTF